MLLQLTSRGCESVGVFDFLKGNKKKRKTGGRSAAPLARRAGEPTRQMPLPPPPGGGAGGFPPPPPQPPPGGPALSAPANPTVARTTPALTAPPVATPAAPPTTPQPSANRPPPVAADGGATQYLVTGHTSGGDIVGVLVCINGELKGEIYRIGDGENRLGRNPECEVELPSQKISRNHAILIHQDGMFVIKPLNEKNPTFLNEVPTEGDELGDGDTIRLGASTLKFRTI